jgi:hypothetical protein
MSHQFDARFAQPNPPNKRAVIGPLRRDGRFPVTFVYPISGRSIRKLIPAAELETVTAGYAVIRKG